MARVAVNGVEIDHEFIGDEGAPVAVLTPGGRYPRDYPGLLELARAVAEDGYRVLSWDRPNCGASDISFDGESESALHADTLVGLADALGLHRYILLGGSAGSRISLQVAARHPDRVSKMFLWWISGGQISMAQLAAYYTGEQAIAAASGGMDAVANHPSFAQQIERNPRNRNIILSWDADAFVERMQLWAAAYAWQPGVPVPGVTAEQYANLDMPVVVLRSGKSDVSHPRATSEEVAALLPNCQLLDPPWGDQEWNECSRIPNQSGRGRFERWPLLAPMIVDFLKG